MARSFLCALSSNAPLTHTHLSPHSLQRARRSAIVMLESNLGMAALEQLLGGDGSGGGSDGSSDNSADDRSGRSSRSSASLRQRGVSPEAAERALKEVIFSHWQRGACEGFEDTLKFTALVDFYLPYFPLERAHVIELTQRALQARAPALARDKGLRLEWGRGVVDFLASKVEFAGDYPLEGAKGVETAVVRHVARLLRHAPARGDSGSGSSSSSGSGSSTEHPAAALVLSVSEDGRELVATVVDDDGAGGGGAAAAPAA